jgi:hypothetical protein
MVTDEDDSDCDEDDDDRGGWLYTGLCLKSESYVNLNFPLCL